MPTISWCKGFSEQIDLLMETCQTLIHDLNHLKSAVNRLNRLADLDTKISEQIARDIFVYSIARKIHLLNFQWLEIKRKWNFYFSEPSGE